VEVVDLSKEKSLGLSLINSNTGPERPPLRGKRLMRAD